MTEAFAEDFVVESFNDKKAALNRLRGLKILTCPCKARVGKVGRWGSSTTEEEEKFTVKAPPVNIRVRQGLYLD